MTIPPVESINHLIMNLCHVKNSRFFCFMSDLLYFLIFGSLMYHIFMLTYWKHWINLFIRYYDDAACVLRKMFLDAKAPHLSTTIPPTLPWKVNEPVQPTEGLTRQGSGIIGTFGQAEELRCVIAVIRQWDFLYLFFNIVVTLFLSLVTSSCYLDSGDRTPKQKVKLKVTEEKLLNLMLKYNGGRPRSEVIPWISFNIFY